MLEMRKPLPGASVGECMIPKPIIAAPAQLADVRVPLKDALPLVDVLTKKMTLVSVQCRGSAAQTWTGGVTPMLKETGLELTDLSTSFDFLSKR